MKLITSALLIGAASAATTPIATFDGAAGTTYKFEELNDPVMGGESTGTWAVDEAGKFGVFDGVVVDVPKLSAPGFIKAAADGKFPDISKAYGGKLVLSVRSSTPTYTGFRVSFAAGTASASYSCAGGGSIPFSRGCFKSKFSVPAGDAFSTVQIPFDSFSDLWSPSTGEQTKTCAEDKSACPTANALGHISRFEVWAEGANGKIHLEIASISAVDANGKLVGTFEAPPPSAYNTCKMPIQDDLRFGLSGRIQPTVPVAVDDTETLADAVCCDSRVKYFGEPQFMYSAPDIALFDKLPADGTPTIFYDSVCGIPLFKAPVNRTLAEFQADTHEHGWPSFRHGEIYKENIAINATTGEMTTACGTHLGTYLPDDAGERYCIDLSCIAGNPK